MLYVASYDDDLVGLERADVPSELRPEVTYRLGKRIDIGGMSIAFHAMRVAPVGKTPVVFKVLRPSFVRDAGEAAAATVHREAVALGRLNEQTPPTPFVSSLVDAGVVDVDCEGTLGLPWLALEHVRGGREGTTLRDRVDNALRATGLAFDAYRAASAIESIAAGISALHGVGVVHRDLEPDRVLCCGFGENEVLKLGDFGFARPHGIAGTSGASMTGTLGYAPPELMGSDPGRVGPWSDVFSAAAIAYFVLTGEEYFLVRTPADVLRAVRSRARRSILDAPSLDPSLRQRESMCFAIDRALARATAFVPEERPQSIESFAIEIVPWIRGDSLRSQVTQSLRDSASFQLAARGEKFRWTTRCPGFEDFAIRAVAWDPDGRCLAATNRGLSLWDGIEWRTVHPEGLPDPFGVRFVKRLAPARWLIGGDGALLAIYGRNGIEEMSHAGSTLRFHHFSGALDDVAVLAAQRDDGLHQLLAVVARKWLRPLDLDDVAFLTGIDRIDATTWLVAGRAGDGTAFLALYEPLQWRIERLAVTDTRALMTCVARDDVGVGFAAGANGTFVWVAGAAQEQEQVEPGLDLSAGALDIEGRAWAASAQKIWTRDAMLGLPGHWTLFHEMRRGAPIVSLSVEPTHVIAMTANGGIVEGTSEPTS